MFSSKNIISLPLRKERHGYLGWHFRNASLEEGQSVLVFGLVFKIENKIWIKRGDHGFLYLHAFTHLDPVYLQGTGASSLKCGLPVFLGHLDNWVWCVVFTLKNTAKKTWGKHVNVHSAFYANNSNCSCNSIFTVGIIVIAYVYAAWVKYNLLFVNSCISFINLTMHPCI